MSVTTTPENARSTPDSPHYAEAFHLAFWGDEDFEYLDWDEEDVCECDLCEWYAEYYLDLRFAGLRRTALKGFAAEGDEVAAAMLVREQEEHFDRFPLRWPTAPWIRWADTGSRTFPSEVKYTLLKIDGHFCRLCGRDEREGNPLEIDHILPLSDGGTDHLRNLWLLCRNCNRAKCAQSLEYFLQRRKDLHIHPSEGRVHWPLGEGVRRPKAAR